MSLPNELVSQFAKLTSNQNKPSNEATVYGTTVNYGGRIYVNIDGSNMLTPVVSTTEIKVGERVTVLIKDHTATIIGNISNPAASTGTMSKNEKEIESLKVTIDGINMDGYVTFTNLATSNSETVINADNITTGTVDASIINVINLNADNITSGYLSGDRIQGGKVAAIDEISFVGGARLFGTTGSYQAGLTISASSYYFGGASQGYLGGSWRLEQDLAIVDGGLTFENADSVLNCYKIDAGDVACSALYSAGTLYADGATTLNGTLTVAGVATFDNAIYGPGEIALANGNNYAPNGTRYRDYVRLGSLLMQSDPAGFLFTDATGAYVPIVGSKAEIAGDVICSDVWASNKVYAANVALTSDQRLKTDIRYVNQVQQYIGDSGLMSPNVKLTTKDMHEFIELLPLVSYRMISEVDAGIDYTYYGFIAQDILYSKVGSELIEYGEVVVTEITTDDDGRPITTYKTEERLRYSENKFIAFICGALKEEMNKRRELELKFEELNNIVEQISNL